jgi:enamine deaminase RidA (YjgF/YER057c/UK114 family)
MNSPTTNLKALGITLPDIAVPAGAYVPALRTGNHVYTAGQLPIVDGKLTAKGKVGSELGVGEAADMARISALNGLAAIHALVGLNAVKRVIKVVGYVASTPDFTDQPQVINGASELLHKVFSDAGTHVRSAVGVASLPLDAPVEVELIVELYA